MYEKIFVVNFGETDGTSKEDAIKLLGVLQYLSDSFKSFEYAYDECGVFVFMFKVFHYDIFQRVQKEIVDIGLKIELS